MTPLPDSVRITTKTSSLNQMISRKHSICFLFKDFRTKSWRHKVMAAQLYGVRAEISQFTSITPRPASCLKLHRKSQSYHEPNEKSGLKALGLWADDLRSNYNRQCCCSAHVVSALVSTWYLHVSPPASFYMHGAEIACLFWSSAVY